eukprot:XP_011674775.1 PREDICTED: transcription termination factor 1-like [Strongylocentrotus purpuratus]
MYSGFWSDEERERLVRVVKELSGFNQDQDVEKLFFNIPWVKVGDAMETRNVHQCRMEWIHIVSWVAADYQTRYTSKGRWNVEDNIRLIEKVYNMDIHDEQDIDWMALLDDFPRVPSPQKLTYYWYRLKVKYVHNYRFKTYEDIVCHLHETSLPELRERLTRGGQKIVSREIVDEESDSGGDETQVVNERNDGQSDGVSMTTNRGISIESRTDGVNEQRQDGEDTEEGRHDGHDEVENEERKNNDRRRTKKRKKRQRNERGTSDDDGAVESNVERNSKDAENRGAGGIHKKTKIDKAVNENSLDEGERISDTRKEKKKKKKRKKRLSDSEIQG